MDRKNHLCIGHNTRSDHAVINIAGRCSTIVRQRCYCCTLRYRVVSLAILDSSQQRPATAEVELPSFSHQPLDLDIGLFDGHCPARAKTRNNTDLHGLWFYVI